MKIIWLLAIAGLAACTTPRQRLDDGIDAVIGATDARIGVAIRSADGETILRNDCPLPMLSIFKLPVALAALDRAAAEGIPLHKPVAVGPEWLDRDTYSPLRDSLPPVGGTVSLADLLRYSVSLSDNIACDLLIDFAGGTGAVAAYLDGIGADGIRITVTEREMHRTPELQRANTARPEAICRLLDRLLRGELLTRDHNNLLRRLLEQSTTGPGKLRAGLPAGTTLGHKTGSSDRDAAGRRIADNDAGYVLLPDGRSYTIAVFVTDSGEGDETNAATIAAISHLAYAYFTTE